MAEFGKLFRVSKIASYDPKIKQVYTNRSNNMIKGDWGIKSNLPLGWRVPVININSIDCYERQPLISSAFHSTLILFC